MSLNKFDLGQINMKSPRHLNAIKLLLLLSLVFKQSESEPYGVCLGGHVFQKHLMVSEVKIMTYL